MILAELLDQSMLTIGSKSGAATFTLSYVEGLDVLE